MSRLSVNLNKIALLRNARGGGEPDLLQAAQTCLDAGAHGLTVHPRPDGRHARTRDVQLLSDLCRERRVEFNLEGNPFADARAGYPGLLALCDAYRPDQVTLVPDDDRQLTSDHGFDFARDATQLKPLVIALQSLGCRVSLFADAGSDVGTAADLGADRIELYTGPYAQSRATLDADGTLEACRRTALQAQASGLGVNAGHDLSQQNLGEFLAGVPNVLEVSIGHALIGEALYDGLAVTVQRYRAIIDGAIR